jgi:hypothetical protein
MFFFDIWYITYDSIYIQRECKPLIEWNSLHLSIGWAHTTERDRERERERERKRERE